MKYSNWLLIFLVILFIIVPIALGMATGAKFDGSDGKAQAAITDIQPRYTPWFQPLFKPPSAEIESLLFALQASLGTGFIAYFFGYKHGLRKGQKD